MLDYSLDYKIPDKKRLLFDVSIKYVYWYSIEMATVLMVAFNCIPRRKTKYFSNDLPGEFIKITSPQMIA